VLVTTRFLETLENLKENVGNNIIYCGDDPYNNFLYIKFAHKVYGIACCDYGIKPQISFNSKQNLLYIGVSQNFICFDIEKESIVFNGKLSFLFYEILTENESEYVFIICECGVICYIGTAQIWETYFKDIICDYKIIGKRLFIKCMDGLEYFLDLQNGKVS
jgi:hypothetical protein